MEVGVNKLPDNLTEAKFLAELEALLDEDPRTGKRKFRNVQLESIQARHRFNVEVWHRRAGKSVIKAVKTIARAVSCPFDEPQYAFMAPTQRQIKGIVWKYLVRYGKAVPGFHYRESSMELWVPTIKGSLATITLFGVDNPKQRLRGLYLDGAVLDEYQDIPEHVFGEQVRPMLSDANRAGLDLWGNINQWCDFIGTPKGRNQLYQQYARALTWYEGKPVYMANPDTGKEEPVYRDDWRAVLHRASETGIISPEELRSAYDSAVSPARFRQEYECDWDAAIEGAVFARELEQIRNAGRIAEISINPLVPVNTAWDLGWDDSTAIWFFQHAGQGIAIVDYVEVNHTSIPDLVQILERKCKEGIRYQYGYHLFPHDVEQTEMGSGKSRRQIFAEAGVRPTKVNRTSLHDQIAAAQMFLLKKAWFSGGRCQAGLDMLALYHRKKDERLGRLQEQPVHDASSHAASALMTLAMGLKREYSGPNQYRNQTRAEI